LTRFVGQSREAEAADFLDFVGPDELAADINAAIPFLERKTQLAVLFDGRHRMETEAVAGNIEHDAAVFRFDVNVSKLFERDTRNVAAFGRGHKDTVIGFVTTGRAAEASSRCGSTSVRRNIHGKRSPHKSFRVGRKPCPERTLAVTVTKGQQAGASAVMADVLSATDLFPPQ